MIDTLRGAGVTADAYTPPKKENKGKKSDPQDALRLGRKVLLDDVNLVRVPPPDERRIRDRVRQRQYFVGERVQFVNRIRHALNRKGIRLATVPTDEKDTVDAGLELPRFAAFEFPTPIYPLTKSPEVTSKG